MKLFKSVIGHLLIVGLLTLFTQIGGLVWLFCLPFFSLKKVKMQGKWPRRFLKSSFFLVVYLLVVFFLVPPLAKWQCGRVPLPVWGNPHLKPHSVFYYCMLNHHYVRPEIKAVTEQVAGSLAQKYPGTVLVYLDANFPFIDGYPLEPHFSHRDGKKIDVALHWKDAQNGKPFFGTPSWYGYGACAIPKPGEQDMEPLCRAKGNWYRSIIQYAAEPFFSDENFEFDEEITREMVKLFAEQKSVGKILLEPHLKTRLRLEKYGKIRFQGCKAVRHDDHIHVQE